MNHLRLAVCLALLVPPAAAQIAPTLTPAPPGCTTRDLSCGLAVDSKLPNGDCLSGCNEHAEIWRIHVFAESTLVSVTASSSEFDPKLELRDTDARLVASNDDTGGRSTARISEVLEPGEYFAIVAAGPAGNDGDYSIRLHCLVSDRKNFCIPDGDTLCLANRFSFRARVMGPDGSGTEAAIPRPQNELYGFFSLPSLTGNADNPELFVKLIDGRAVNGRWWVFWSGVTGLDYEITVRDSFTRTERTFRGQGADTETFGEP